MYIDGLTLDDWEVGSIYASNEDGCLVASAIYDFGWEMDTEHLKIIRGE